MEQNEWMDWVLTAAHASFNCKEPPAPGIALQLPPGLRESVVRMLSQGGSV
jgi:hypothetical protein